MSLFQSGAYQSQTLRAIVRQVRRLADRSRQTWRSLRTITTWTAQIAVYPIYVAYQSIRLGAFSLPKLVAALKPRSQKTQDAAPPSFLPLVPDTPLKNVFLKVRELALPMSGVPLERLLPVSETALVGIGIPSALASRQSGLQKPDSKDPITYIRGLASTCEGRSLVLVTNHNQILDILTPRQQQWLRQQIIGEVASYARAVKRHLAGHPVFSPIRPALAGSRVFPIVRAFQRLMAWEQRGTIALAANLFREASLLPPEVFISPEPLSPESFSLEKKAPEPLPTLAAPPALTARTPAPLQPTASAIARSTPSQPLLKPDYVETPATLVRYEQSPWERFWRWVDRLVLNLERQISEIWHFLKRLL